MLDASFWPEIANADVQPSVSRPIHHKSMKSVILSMLVAPIAIHDRFYPEGGARLVRM